MTFNNGNFKRHLSGKIVTIFFFCHKQFDSEKFYDTNDNLLNFYATICKNICQQKYTHFMYIKTYKHQYKY